MTTYQNSGVGTPGAAVTAAGSASGGDAFQFVTTSFTSPGSALNWNATDGLSIVYTFGTGIAQSLITRYDGKFFTTGGDPAGFTQYMSGLIYCPSRSGPPMVMGVLNQSAGTYAYLQVNANSTVSIYVLNPTATAILTSTVTVPTGAFFLVDWYVKFSSTAVGEARLRVFTTSPDRSGPPDEDISVTGLITSTNTNRPRYHFWGNGRGLLSTTIATASMRLSDTNFPTNAVESQLVQTWNVQATAQQTLAESWNVRATAQQTLANTWNVRAATQQALAQAWNVRALTQQTLAESWNVAAGVQQTLAHSWNVRALVQQTLAQSWQVAAGVQQTLVESWNVRQTALEDLATSWNVRALVQNGLLENWNVAAGVAGALTSSWNVAALVAAELSTTWDVLANGQVSSTLSTTWNVAEGVSATLDQGWAVRALTAASLVQSWHVRSLVAQTLAESWNVAVTAGESVTSELVTAWAVRRIALRTYATSWNVDGPVIVRQPGDNLVYPGPGRNGTGPAAGGNDAAAGAGNGASWGSTTNHGDMTLGAIS